MAKRKSTKRSKKRPARSNPTRRAKMYVLTRTTIYAPPQQSIPTLPILRRRPQKGGSDAALLLTNADAPAMTTPQVVDFEVRFQPTVKASVFGTVLTRSESRSEPHPLWTKPVAPVMNTFMCWDPDAPEKSWLHWLVVNCTDDSPASGNMVAPWFPPLPPPGAPEHRYIFGLFEQTGPINIPPMQNGGKFSPNAFVAQHGLKPIAYKGIRVKHE